MTPDRNSTPSNPEFKGPFRSAVVNPRAAHLSASYDVAADRVWFALHPEAMYRYREASDLELAAYDFPPGTVVVVQLRQGELFYFFAVHGPALCDHRAKGGPVRHPGRDREGEGRREPE